MEREIDAKTARTITFLSDEIKESFFNELNFKIKKAAIQGFRAVEITKADIEIMYNKSYYSEALEFCFSMVFNEVRKEFEKRGFRVEILSTEKIFLRKW